MYGDSVYQFVWEPSRRWKVGGFPVFEGFSQGRFVDFDA